MKLVVFTAGWLGVGGGVRFDKFFPDKPNTNRFDSSIRLLVYILTLLLACVSAYAGDCACDTKGRETKVEWLTGAFGGWRLERVFGGDGRQVSATLFDAQGAAVNFTGFSYENGNLDTVTGNGSTADYGRDAQSLLVTGWSRDGASGGALTDLRSFGAGGRLTGVSGNVAGVPSFSYADFDSSGRRKRTVTDGFGWDYDYDSHGHLTRASHPTLGTFVYGVNGLGVRDSARGWAMASNALNQPTQLAHATSYKLQLGAHPQSRIWVNGIEVVNPNGAPFEHEVQVSGVGADGGYFQYLIEASRAGAGDATPGGGNATARAAVKGFSYVPPGVEDFKHDADGNREESARWKYFWDGRNRLVKAETKGFDPVAGEQPGVSLTFDYDSEGRRFKKTVVRRFWDKNTWKTEEKTCWFLYDGWSLVYERQEPGIQATMGTVAATLERSYTHGLDLSGSRGGAGGAGGVLNYRETKNGQSELYFPFYDGGGNVVSLVRGSDRKVVASYRYGPFGEMIKAEGEMAETNPLRFATQYFDQETSLSYFGMRYFDSTTGSWLSREPLGEAESLNLYAYCGHDPVNGVDVMGLNPFKSLYNRISSDFEYLGRTSATGKEIRRIIHEEVIVKPVAGVILKIKKEGEVLDNLGTDSYLQSRSNWFFDNTVGAAGEQIGRTWVATAAAGSEAGSQRMGISEGLNHAFGTGMGELLGTRKMLGGFHGVDIQVDQTMTGFTGNQLDYDGQWNLMLSGMGDFTRVTAPLSISYGKHLKLWDKKLLGNKKVFAAGRLAGSGPAPGVLEVSDLVKSTKAFQNYKPGQAIEFVFDPKRNRFVVGRAVGRGSPHQNLAAIIDADSSVVGGMFKRGSNGEILTNEFSGHYWENWTPAVRTQFQQHLERLSGQAINHTPGM